MFLWFQEKSYNWANNKKVEVFDSTVVEIVSSAGVCGFGEVKRTKIDIYWRKHQNVA